MRIDILTIFPEFFDSPLRSSIIARAREAGHVSINLHDIRDWTEDKHHCTDDTPYGGGGGMVMKPGPVVNAVRCVREMTRRLPGGGDGDGEIPVIDQGADEENTEAATMPAESAPPPHPVIYLSPQGEPLTARIVDELAAMPGMILLCGNYEGIDERAIELAVDREISIGDYVLTGGEIAALVLLNAVARKIPGVLGNEASAPNDSFETGLLDCPHYTRPEVFEDLEVPEVLLSGHHAKIVAWRREQALRATARRRPDLIDRDKLSEEEKRIVDEEIDGAS